MARSLTHAEILYYTYIPMLLIELGIFSRLLYRMFIRTETRYRRISVFQQRAHIMFFCCIILTSFCDMGHALGSILSGTSLIPKRNWIIILEVGADAFYYVSSLLIYLILIQRLYTTFESSAYRLSPFPLHCIVFIMFIQFLSMIFYCATVGMHPDPQYNLHWYLVLGWLAACIAAVDGILDLLLFALFCYKLHQLARLRVEHDFRSMSIGSALSQNSNSRLLDVITKQTIIGLCVVIFNAGFALAQFIMDHFSTETPQNLTIVYSVRAVQGVIISMLLYLGLAMNDAEYRRVCGCCHRTFHDIGSNNLRRQITKEPPMVN